MSDAQRQLYATENFGPGPIIPADYFRLPAPKGSAIKLR